MQLLIQMQKHLVMNLTCITPALSTLHFRDYFGLFTTKVFSNKGSSEYKKEENMHAF